MEIISITINSDKIFIYLCRNYFMGNEFIFLFEHLGYYVYYKRREIDLQSHIIDIKNHIFDYLQSKKENEQNVLNVKRLRLD